MMEYRFNRKTGDQISEIGIGSSYMFGAGMDEAVLALRLAVDGESIILTLPLETAQHFRFMAKRFMI